MKATLTRRDDQFPQAGLAAIRDWISTRPPAVQALAAEFPPGAYFDVEDTDDEIDGRLFIVGWTEDDRIMLSAVDPLEDYDVAHALRFPVCAHHFRQS